MYSTPGMQDGTVIARESWLRAVFQDGDGHLCSRVGTGVQPLQGENYTYSHVLGHVQPLIRLHFHRVVLLDILYLPLVYFPARIAVEVRGAGVVAPKSGVLEGVC